MPENRSSLAAYVRTRTRTNVLPRVLPPAAQKTASFRDCPSPLAGTLAPQDTATTIGKIRVCTDVQRGEVPVRTYGPLYDANIAARPPQINYKSMQLSTRRPGHYH